MTDPIDQRCIDTLRFLAVDMVQKADSGHPGLPLGAAPMAYVLWQRLLKFNPNNPDWFDRDRFVLSAGHGSALLYALLHMTGYDVTLDDIKQFRQWGSKTPGHPERRHTPGVEVTTGPLGQGMANAVGLAIAEAQLAARYNRPGHEIVDHRTWALVSDGDLMEGVGAEATSLAGHLQLGKLNCLYDDNFVTLSAGTDITFTEDRGARFEACGWHVQHVDDGNDVEAIATALEAARDETARPSLVVVHTHIGYGSPEQDSYKAHGSPLGVEDVRKTKQTLSWPVDPSFLVPDAAREHMRKPGNAGADAESVWEDRFKAYAKAEPALAAELEGSLQGRLPDGWDADIPDFPADAKGMATRASAGKVVNAVAPKLPQLTGGSADLDPSTKTAMKGLGDFNPVPEGSVDSNDRQGSDGGGWSHAGRNLHFGVREHAMGAIANGLAAHGGCMPFTATFLVFADYMRPPMRLAALSKLHVIFVFTHDSIAVGEDGPTHEPVEQIASLRAIPGLTVIRPCDANEAAVAWRVAIETRDAPVTLVFCRQDVPTLDRGTLASADGLRRGAYVLDDAVGDEAAPAVILIATGSEVHLIVEAARRLRKEGIPVRCVSMPSWELFEAQSDAYRESVLPAAVTARLAVEAGVSQGWSRYVRDAGDMLGVDRYGASAPGDTVMAKYGFTVDNVCDRARALLPQE
ncbi:MAG: transketolase [Casimicrobiaceae bacterium]